jgi:polyisoprenoid-binding protein YceI
MLKFYCLSLASLLSTSALAAPENYTIDASHTFPSFTISHMGFSMQRGRFNNTEGSIVLDRAAKQLSVVITIDADSIDTGLDELEDHLRNADFFNVKQYPEITFKSTKAVFQGDTPVSVQGELTLRGQTKPVTLNIVQFRCGTNPIHKQGWCGAEVTGTLKRSEFGMTIYPPPILGDEVKLELQIEAAKGEKSND